MDNPIIPVPNLVDKAESYLSDLHSDYEDTREPAFDALKEIGPDRILGQLLEANGSALEECNTIWRSRAMITSVAIGVSGYLLVSSLSACNKDPYGSVGSFLFAVLCTGLSGLFFLFRKPSSGSQYRQRSLLKLLCLSNDPRCVGALCDYIRSPALRKRNFDLNLQVVGALSRLLPHVSESADGPLTSLQHTALRTELRRISRTDYSYEADIVANTDAGMATALLRFIEAEGDLGAIRDVERLANRPSAQGQWVPYSDQTPLLTTNLPSSQGQWTGVIEQANRCLATLLEIKSAEKQGRALLRSSEKPQAASTELLRQAKSPGAEPAELLRPGSQEESGQDE